MRKPSGSVGVAAASEWWNHLTEKLHLSRYTLYVQDYGGPVGLRMALTHPQRVQALIIQNAVAHNEGLGEIWKPRRAFWADRAANEDLFRANFLSLETTRTRHVGHDSQVDRYDPDLWTHEFAFLDTDPQFHGDAAVIIDDARPAVRVPAAQQTDQTSARHGHSRRARSGT